MRPAVFSYRDFRLNTAARFLGWNANMMTSVALGWEVYARTHRVRDLGLLGLFQFIPAVLLLLVGGDVADRFDRRRVAVVSYGSLVLLSLLLVAQSRYGSAAVWPIFAVVTLFAVARAFIKPVFGALVRDIVPGEHFGQAVAWGGVILEAGNVVGPAIGGWLYGVTGRAGSVYLASAALYAVATLLLAMMSAPPARAPQKRMSLETLLAGVAYVWKTKFILGSLSLDLFAAFFGGAVALMPVYARDILFVGPTGLGLLRSAPSIGAVITAGVMAFHPPKRHAGTLMLGGVALFGAATVVFGLSRDVVLSLGALVVLGAADQVSVLVRHTLVQLATPGAMRGRVMAINEVFIGTSNELGDLESGIAASLVGTVPAVVFGGLAAIAVVVVHALRFPELRKAELGLTPAPAPAPAAPLSSPSFPEPATSAGSL